MVDEIRGSCKRLKTEKTEKAESTENSRTDLVSSQPAEHLVLIIVSSSFKLLYMFTPSLTSHFQTFFFPSLFNHLYLELVGERKYKKDIQANI